MGLVERYSVVVIPASSTLHDNIGPLSNRLFYGHDTKDIWVSTIPDCGSRLGLLLCCGMYIARYVSNKNKLDTYVASSTELFFSPPLQYFLRTRAQSPKIKSKQHLR